jgi:prolipoprotein diacylglyceryltransferase
MTFPIDIALGPVKLNAHLVFEILAFSIGFRFFLFKRKKQTDAISQDNRIWIILGATFGALLFSRLIGALENPLLWKESSNKFIYLFTNKTITGGLAGGLIGVELVKKFIHEKKSSGDLFTTPLILAMMIGRIGCFSNGIHEETYGISTSLPWGMNLGDGIIRHPVTLYEILFLGITWGILHLLSNKQFRDGMLFQFFMIAYFIFRFLLDFIKPHFTYDFGLSSIQILCILVIIYYSKTIILLLTTPKKLLSNA